MARELVFSVTLKDCDVQTFSVSGAGGQRRDKKATGVRIVHRASGAVGQCTEHREQLRNKKEAWKRMNADPKFIYWVKIQLGRIESDEAYLDRQMAPENIRVEVRDGNKWKSLD